jgi:hypothetical protein
MSQKQKPMEISGMDAVSADVENGSVEQRVKELINAHDVMLFSKTTCAFCFGVYCDILMKCMFD